MGLTNSQYDAIMRIYSRLQLENARTAAARREEAYDRIPALRKLDLTVSEAAALAAREALEGSEEASASFRSRLDQIRRKREALLTGNGYPADYLDPPCRCPDCHDTGFLPDGTQCHCFRQAAIDLLYSQSGMREILQKENFDTFSLDYYPSDIRHPVTGKTSRQNMEDILSGCRRFIEDFDKESQNLFFYGDTGLGKTFLSHCIAKELIETSHSVMYFTAFDLFEQLAKDSFSKASEAAGTFDFITECDLLIIDDLGTELTNAFVSSRLFLLLNERLRSGKSIIISTNLPLAKFAEVYSERIFSRITSGFLLMNFFGSDIRIQKKLSGRS